MKKILLIIITLAFLVSGCYTTFYMNDKSAGSITYINTIQDDILIVKLYSSYNYYSFEYYDWYIWPSSRIIFYPYYYSSIRFDYYWSYLYYYNNYYYYNYYLNWKWKHKTKVHLNNVTNIVFPDKHNNSVSRKVRNNTGQRNEPTVRQKEIKTRYNETYRQKESVKRNNEVIKQPVKRNEGVKITSPVKRNTEVKRTK